MKLLLSLALTLVAVNPAQAQCTDYCPGGITNLAGDVEVGGTEEIPCSEINYNVFLTQSVVLLRDSAYWQSADRTQEQCDSADLLAEIVISCCPEKQTPQDCFLCGSVTDTFNADKVLPGAPSCGILDTTLSYVQNDEAQCANARAGILNSPFDFLSYCECSSASPPNICKPCGDNQVVNAEAIVPDGDGETCGVGAELASHLTQAGAAILCPQFQNTTITDVCCSDVSAGGIIFSMSSLVAALLLGVGFAI
ncbi:MAG: hypothetical protein SGBAC_003979 [Bacillariaceae sp.]